MSERARGGQNIAVVGGGIFGCEVASQAAKAGNSVVLYERQPDIMMETSEKNQRRDHDELDKHFFGNRENLQLFAKTKKAFYSRYARAIRVGVPVLLGLAKENSKTSRAQLVKSWNELGTIYREDYSVSHVHTMSSYEDRLFRLVNPEPLQFLAEISENFYDFNVLKRLAGYYLIDAGVDIKASTEFTKDDVKKHDQVVVCTYGEINRLLDTPMAAIRYILTEKPEATLPPEYRNLSVNIFDGPFGSIDANGITGNHLVGCVVESVHGRYTGHQPRNPSAYNELMRPGMRPAEQIKDISHFEAFRAKLTPFIPGMAEAKHIGSWFVNKAYPVNGNDSDRPTIIERPAGNDPRIIVVWGGKIRTVSWAAEEVVKMINEHSRQQRMVS